MTVSHIENNNSLEGRPKLSDDFEEIFGQDLKVIDQLSERLNEDEIKKMGEPYFNFKKLSPLHDENINTLINALDEDIDADLMRDVKDLQKSGCSELDHFQRSLRLQKALMAKGIRLVGIDISKTIINYSVTENQRRMAAKLIREFLASLSIFKDEESIIMAMDQGFREYDAGRQKDCQEIQETDFYKKYVCPKWGVDLTDEAIMEIARIWRSHSVSCNPNTSMVEELVRELQSRDITVITVSDMLGPMSTHALSSTGLYLPFDAHFSSDDFGYRKKHPQKSLFSIATETMRIKPENACFIGNDRVDDMASSYAQGWKRRIFISDENSDSVPHDLQFGSLDGFYHALMADNVGFLPRLRKTPYVYSAKAIRNDSPFYKILYALRQKVKPFPDRELREWAYRKYLVYNLGEKSRIGNNVEIRFPDRIYIGNNCQLNDNFTVLNEGPVIIGNDVMVANNVFIATHNHNWQLGMVQDKKDNWAKGNTSSEPVSIESNCWIGPNSCLESGVYIGHNSMVAANTFVRRGTYPPYSFLRGNPAKVENIRGQIEAVFKTFVK